jgi:integrase
VRCLRASGICLSELAGIRYDPDDLRRSDVDLWEREITVHGKGRRTRIVKIGYDAARGLDRYLRMRARHPLAHRPELWLGVNNRGPLTPLVEKLGPLRHTILALARVGPGHRPDCCQDVEGPPGHRPPSWSRRAR